jgi:vancomycin permeability regulator SanA
MLDRLIQIITRLFWVAFLVFVMTAAVMVYDGQRNSAGHADLAIVPGHGEMETGEAWSNVQPRLDLAIQLYQDNKISMILVSGAEKTADYYEAGSMVQYLEGKGIPSKAIMGDEGSGDTREMVGRWLARIKEGNFTSVMIVTNYYQITRLKLAFWKQGGGSIGQAYVGTPQAADAYDLLREDVEFYRYFGNAYLGPTARHTRSEARKMKHAVDDWFNSLVK